MTVTEQLRKRLAEGEETLYRVAKEVEVSWSTLDRFVKGGAISGELVDKLATYFGAQLVMPRPKKPKGSK